MRLINRCTQVAVAILTLLVASKSVSAQGAVVDHWRTMQECKSATSAPYYYPRIVRAKKLAPGEVVAGAPYDMCVDMDLPDRAGGRGIVKIEAGRKLVYRNGVPVRLEECNNDIYGSEPIPRPVGLQGPIGPVGPQGPPGAPGNPGRDFPQPRVKKTNYVPVLIGTAVALGVGCAILCPRSKASSRSSSSSSSGFRGGLSFSF